MSPVDNETMAMPKAWGRRAPVRRAAPKARLNALSWVVLPTLFVIVFGSLNVDIYFKHVYLFELGIALNVGLLLMQLFWVKLSAGQMVIWVAFPAALLAFFIGLWGFMFQLNTGATYVFSSLALRGWAYYLLTSNIYIAHLGGVDWRKMAFSIVSAMFVATALIGIAYAVLPLNIYAVSADPYVRRLVMVDELRGVRLRVPWFSLAFVFFFCAIESFRTKFRSLPMLAMFAVSVAVWTISYSRVLVLSSIVAVLVYKFVFRTKQFFFVGLGFMGVVLSLAVGFIINDPQSLTAYLSRDNSFLSRSSTLAVALSEIPAHPIFGYGKDSYNTISFSYIFGPFFSPSDIGLLGTLFRFGVVGVIVYLALAVSVVTSLRYVILNNRQMSNDSFVIALSLTTLLMLVSSVSFIGFIDDDGVMIAACSLAFALIGRRMTVRR